MPIDSTDLPALPALVRARDTRGEVALLLWRDGRLRRLGTSLDVLLERPLERIRSELEQAGEEADPSRLDLLAPVEGQEVWAAGVTYRRSREARREESSQGGDFYDLVYEAARPELFFKASGWRVVGPGGDVGVRSDSRWDVPEPELVALSNRHGEVVAYTCGNDMSSRSIEGENPLYLPQAKVYDNSCALGPAAVLAWEYEPAGKEMRLQIRRRGEAVFEGAASLDDMVRRPDEVSGVLHSALTLPLGAWLMTGTSIVPEPDYTARPGDEVVIGIEGLGRLRNRVVEVSVGSASAPARVR